MAASKYLAHRGRVIPGLDGPIEGQRDTVQIAEANTTGSVVFTFGADFTEAPAVSTGARLGSASAGSASTKINRVEITAISKDSVTVQVELDAAPGAGETQDVEISITAIGKGPS